MAEFNLDDNDMMTSFSNPNYGLSNVDALNSNITSQYYDNDEHVNNKEGSESLGTNGNHGDSTSMDHKGRTQYAHMDLTSAMGMDLLTPEGHMTNSNFSSPDSANYADSEGRLSSADSAVNSPSEKTQELVEVEHTEDDMPYADDATPSKGFMGYYASLERSKAGQDHDRHDDEYDDEGNSEKGEGECEGDGDASSPETPLLAQNKTRTDNRSFEDKLKDINSPDSNDSGIQADVQHIHGPITDDIYAVSSKTKRKDNNVQHIHGPVTDDLYAVIGDTKRDEHSEESSETEKSDDTDSEQLPPGWQKHEDEEGAYYWHIKTGTIQREPPPRPPPGYKEPPSRSISTTSDSSQSSVSSATESSPPREHLQEFEGHAYKYAAASIKSLSSTAKKEEEPASDYPIRFAVRSLGWVKIHEEDLTPERSSKAVNKCIVDLSLGKNDINDVVGRWGDGKDLFMDLDEQNLTLIDPQDMSVLNVQSIHSIRVWGVGRDNGRDFAYVARDRITRRHMCHVFRCDTPARQIANTLRDICKKIMLERSLLQAGAGAGATTAGMQRMGISHRPTNLPNLEKVGQANGEKLTFESLLKSASFPTPMEEPKKVLRCHYLGTANLPKSTGVELLNSAMQKVYSRVPPEKWVFVSVAVAPSTITITEHGKPENVLAECRVRFLSFMGIAMENVKLCSFIMHTAQDQYITHVFHCEPSAGALCKTIEAACKLRYQKCLDSHVAQSQQSKKQNSQSQKGLGASIRQGVQSVFGLGKGKKSKS